MQELSPDDWNVLETDPRLGGWNIFRIGLAEQQIGAVLLSDEIEYYASLANLPLIAPFDRDNLQPASYKLTLGSRARVGGEDLVVNEENPLQLPPHDVAVVTTFETLRIPRFLIARWNLRVRMVYEGLLWTGALQVDPGWVGRLIAPIYNLSNREVRIYFRQPLFTMDFVRTTPFSNGCLKFARVNRNLEAYDVYPLRSAPRDVRDRLGEIEVGVRNDRARFEERIDTINSIGLVFAGLVLTVLAAITAALAVSFTDPVVNKGAPLLDFWPFTAVTLSIGAIVLSLGNIGILASLAFIWRHRRG